MTGYTAKVHQTPGGDTLVVESGGAIQVKTGGKILPNGGTQPANITDISTTTATMSTAERQAFNSILAALRGAGIIAAS